MKCSGAIGSAAITSPNSRCTSASLITVTGVIGRFGVDRDRLANSRELHRPGGSRDRRTANGAVGLIGEQNDEVAALRGGAHAPRPAAGGQNGGERRHHHRDGASADHSVTRTASDVPRTPTTAAGVSRRIASGESFAIRPDTYAITPRTTLSTSPIRASAGA